MQEMWYHNQMERKTNETGSLYKHAISSTMGKSDKEERVSVSDFCKGLKAEIAKSMEAYIAQHGDTRFAVCSARVDIQCDKFN